MKKSNLLSIGLFTSALFWGTVAESVELDRIAAVANNDIVTVQELSQRVTMIKQQYRANPNVLPSDAVLNKQVLDALILESLQLQLAERGNLKIPNTQIDAALSRIAQRQNMTLTQYLQAVQNSGQSVNTLREQISRELTINELQKQIIGRQIFISDTEVDRALAGQTGQALSETQYQLYYYRAENQDDTSIDQLVTQLNAGESLLDTTGAKDLGFNTLAKVPSLFRTLVPVLKEGEAIQLTQNGVTHVVQLAKKSQVESVNVDEYQIRHILIKTTELLDAESAQQLLRNIKSQIENGASMAELADQFSEDTGTRGRGGLLDWTTLDSYVGEFGEMAKATPVGTVSDIFESPYGYHILRVEDKRTSDIGVDALRDQIRNQLYQRRYNESLQRWLTELRAESFVEVRN